MNNYDADLHETWYRFFGPSVRERRLRQLRPGTGLRRQGRGQHVELRALRAGQLAAGIEPPAQSRACASRRRNSNSGERRRDCRRVRRRSLRRERRVPHGGRPHAQGHWAPRLGLVVGPDEERPDEDLRLLGPVLRGVPLNMNIRAINGESYIITQYVSTTDADTRTTGTTRTAARSRSTDRGTCAGCRR